MDAKSLLSFIVGAILLIISLGIARRARRPRKSEKEDNKITNEYSHDESTEDDNTRDE